MRQRRAAPVWLLRLGHKAPRAAVQACAPQQRPGAAIAPRDGAAAGPTDDTAPAATATATATATAADAASGVRE